MEFVNAVVIHKAFGEGTISSLDAAHVKVDFSKVGPKVLQYPMVFEKGFLRFKDEEIQKELEAELYRANEAAEKKKAEEIELKKMEEEEKKAKQDALKKSEEEKKVVSSPAINTNIPVTGTMKYSKRKLINEMAEGKTFVFHPFYGHKVEDPVSHYCFSNWYPCNFVIDGVTYHTTEQYMMAHKALVFEDISVYEEIMSVDDPKQYKTLGRKVTPFDPATWNKYKYGIVLEGCKAKFSQNPEFAKVLLATGDEVIVEAAPRDIIWGVGLGAANEKINDPSQWRGTNYLGFVLMEVRDWLRSQE